MVDDRAKRLEQVPTGMNVAGEQFLSTRVAENSGDSTISYIGTADPGTAESAAQWMIQEVTTVGTSVSTKHADGSPTFTQVWDDRESLSYS